MAAILDLSHTPYIPVSIRLSWFLRFPREVRDLIYAFALHEPNLHSKRHRIDCPYLSWSMNELEIPPFIIMQRPEKCNCHARQDLSLLLVNKQIYAEAASRFWRDNILCGSYPWSLWKGDASAIERIRTQYLQHLRLLVSMRGIVSPREIYSPTGSESRSITREVWDGWVLKCAKLRTLELEPVYLGWFHDKYAQLRECCPHLEKLSLVHMQSHTVRGTRCANSLEGPALYVKITKQIPLDLTADELKETIRRFSFNLCVFINQAGIQNLLQPSGPEGPVLKTGLHDGNTLMTWGLRDGSQTTVAVYGLPTGPATRRANGLALFYEQEALKRAGKPTLQEVKAEATRAELAKAKKLEKERKEDVEAEEKMKKKAETREKEAGEEKVAEKKKERNKTERLNRKIRRQDKGRKEERKRVAPKM
ncbi:hypothetical protein AJ80_06958 [Polytolypa hystricis UAMH7299]|uniref:Uncharacterized protein n=1 Tax=Polytolypa hystricis (strain UAMH7299) TaxID=1447883 RepID=A0A2B7XS43_POLH7|nr:hypothetical protein AJ80_06958 [Polytolypa hystricis UAMH7299]